MEEIRFNSEALNKLMTEKTGKESFSKEDIKEHMDLKELDFQGEQVSQEDINLLIEIIKRLDLRNADLSNVRLAGLKIEEVIFHSCNIPQDFFKDSKIKYAELNAYELANEGLKKLSKARNVKEVFLIGNPETNLEKILEDYPDFKELSSEEQEEITSDLYYQREQNVDLSQIKKLRGLKELDISGINISQHNANEIASARDLKSLWIENVNLSSNVVFPQIPSLKKLVFIGNIQSIDSFAKQKKLKTLSIEQEKKCCNNVSRLQNFVNLQSLELYGIDGVEDNLPASKNLKNLILKNSEIEFDMNSFEYIDIDSFNSFNPIIQEALARNFKGKVKIKTLKGLSADKIKMFRKNVKFEIEHDFIDEYTPEEVLQILKVMEQIKSQIPENASEYEKFDIVYNIIGKSANYDYSGCKDNEQYTEESKVITRSLKGILLQGRAVCAGYALALKHCLDYVGIEAKYVVGDATKKTGEVRGAHAWNQVCIDGKWYNVDLTWDYANIQRGKPLAYCLVRDEIFNEDHKITPKYKNEEIHKCDSDYNSNEVRVVSANSTRTNFGKGVPTLFGISDYREIAQETVIEPSTIEKLKNKIAKQQKQQKQQIMQEESEK